jgi:RNA polymerase sigma factor (sigma-70 family)
VDSAGYDGGNELGLGVARPGLISPDGDVAEEIGGGQKPRRGTYRGRKMDASPSKVLADPFDELYTRCMEPLQARMRAWFPTLKGCEEDLYQTAWASLLANGRTVEDPEKYLEVAVYNAGLKELRRRRRRPIVPLSLARFRNGAGGTGAWQQGPDALAERTEPLPEEQVESREDARLLAELLEELTPLQRRIIKLRWGMGLSRREAARFLGISEKTVKRQMEKAEPLIARNADLARAGRWCELKESLVIAYSLGWLGDVRAAKARVHLDQCPACRAVARTVRDRLESLAAVMPLPALVTDSHAQGLFSRAGELAETIRNGADQLAAGAKGHALAFFARTPAADTAAGQIAAGGGLRGGGSVLAAVTACLIAGGGATYCAIEGVPQTIRDLAPLEQAQEESPRAEQPAQTKPQPIVGEQKAPEANAPAQDRAQVEDKPSKPEQAASGIAATAAQPSPAPEGSVEFGSTAPSSASTRPAAAPASGGGEFTP